MIIAFNYKKSLLVNLILFLIFALHFWHNSLPLAIGGAIIFFLFNSWLLGHKAMPGNSYVVEQLFGFLFLSLICSLFGTIAFYFYLIKPIIWLTLTAGITLIFPFWQIKKPAVLQLNLTKPKFNLWLLMLSTLYLLLTIIMFALVKGVATDLSIRSPWEVIPSQLFLVYFLATLILYIITKFSKKAWPLVLIIIHAFFTLSVAFFVYHIGFGYDPFIHRTNLQLIADSGTLLPKPFYYIGQYSLLLFYNYLFKIPLDFLDKILIPLLSAVYLPLIIYSSFKDNFKTKNNLLLLTVFSIFIFPLSSFIATTPQALANLLSLITVALSLYYLHQNKAKLWPLYLLVLTILSIHPLAGIPIAFFVAVSVFYHHWKQKDNLPKLLKHSIVWEMIILGCLALPLAFLINSLTLSELKVSFQAGWFSESLKNLSKINLGFYYRKFISLPDMLYTYNFNLAWLYLGLSALGLGFIIKHKQLKKYLIFIFGLIITVANYLFLKTMIHFFSLQSYEQINYPNRILELSVYLLMPFILIGLYLIFQKLNKNSWFFSLMMFILLALAQTSAFYYTYPRVDKIKETHGYSTSATDLETVNFLEKLQSQTEFKPYIVLATQPVSAGAIKELGFKHYYNNLFFYPVPTGGRLYQLYEDFAYSKQKTSEIMATAKYLTGVDTVYVVINKYWLDAEKIIEETKENAVEWFSIDNKNYIFKY